MNNIIVGMGEALWDVLPEGKKIGGAPANFAYHVSQFGFDSRVVSAVGNDELGDEIMSVFKDKKLNTQIERVDYPTGIVQVTLDAEGVPCYEIKEGVARFKLPYPIIHRELMELRPKFMVRRLYGNWIFALSGASVFVKAIDNDEKDGYSENWVHNHEMSVEEYQKQLKIKE